MFWLLTCGEDDHLYIAHIYIELPGMLEMKMNLN